MPKSPQATHEEIKRLERKFRWLIQIGEDGLRELRAGNSFSVKFNATLAKNVGKELDQDVYGRTWGPNQDDVAQVKALVKELNDEVASIAVDQTAEK